MAVLAGLCTGGIAFAQHGGGDHLMTSPADLNWAPVPAIPGAQIAVIEGPLSESGKPFTARIKFPANSRVPPHWHSTVEHVTVMSGTLNMGLGDTFNDAGSRALGPGSVSIMQAGTHHFAWFGEETILQLHGIGPWTVSYVNPADDPTHRATASEPAPASVDQPIRTLLRGPVR
jgi:quercetin dioxygenase-like cupin family protein